ncbi:MAG: CDP-alcohol phosphatidyltransferase family protein [Candidatus Pacebacteria bacterium]|nr:CDP-alcohol phosphatidyltransferase family protein [Candidatus Paceibacterota bacterium]
MLTTEIRNFFSGFTTSVGKTLGKMGVSANFVTFLVLVFGFIAAYFIYSNNFPLAILFVILSGIMDGFDGAVAKANHKETKFGALFDSVTDKVTEISWYIALGFFNPALWGPATLALTFFMLSSYISKHAKSIGGESGGGIIERKERLILIILGLIFSNLMIYILYIIAFFSFITSLQRFYKNYKILKKES